MLRCKQEKAHCLCFVDEHPACGHGLQRFTSVWWSWRRWRSLAIGMAVPWLMFHSDTLKHLYAIAGLLGALASHCLHLCFLQSRLGLLVHRGGAKNARKFPQRFLIAFNQWPSCMWGWRVSTLVSERAKAELWAVLPNTWQDQSLEPCPSSCFGFFPFAACPLLLDSPGHISSWKHPHVKIPLGLSFCNPMSGSFSCLSTQEQFAFFSPEPMLLDSPSFRSSFPSLHSSVISFQPHAFKSQVWVLKGFLLYHDVPTGSQASLYASLPSQADIIKVGRRCHGRWIEEFKSCCFLGEFPLWQGNESQIRGQRMWGEPRVWMVKPLKVLPPNEQLLLFLNNSPWNLTLAWVICLFFGYIYLFIYWWGRRQWVCAMTHVWKS